MAQSVLCFQGATAATFCGLAEYRSTAGVLRAVKIKAHSKPEALKKLGRNLRIFTDKLEVSGGLGMASQLSPARCQRRRARIAADTVA
jgi:hypothetical protein